jgi:hypothetical protein
MLKIDFFKRWFEMKAYGSKAAVQSVIAIQLDDEDSAGAFKKIPGAVFVEKGKFHAMLDGEQVTLEGNVEEPFAVMDTKFSFPGDFHPILKDQAVESTFGLMLFNVILWWEPFMGKVDYVNTFFTKKLIEGHISRLMVDNPKEGETVPEGKASVADCLKFTENCYYLEGLGAHFVKPGGVDALTVSKEILKRKDELLKQHAHELNDPVVFTAILDELVAMDRAEMMKGKSKNFFINDKFIGTARKRMFIAFGIEENPTSTGWVALPRSLDQGLDPEQIVTQVNTAVSGAYSRSMATGEGGSAVKETLRLIGRSKVEGTDCGTPRGEMKIVLKDSASYWMGSSYISNGKVIFIDKEELNKIIGKPVAMRVPQFCLTVDGDYCKTCLGEGLSKIATRLSAEVVRVPTEMMLQRMKAHHQAGSNTVVLNLKTAIK